MLRDWILAEGQIIFSREILSLRLMDAPNLSSNYKNALWDERGSAFWGQIYEERVTARCCGGTWWEPSPGPGPPDESEGLRWAELPEPLSKRSRQTHASSSGNVMSWWLGFQVDNAEATSSQEFMMEVTLTHDGLSVEMTLRRIFFSFL